MEAGASATHSGALAAPPTVSDRAVCFLLSPSPSSCISGSKLTGKDNEIHPQMKFAKIHLPQCMKNLKKNIKIGKVYRSTAAAAKSRQSLRNPIDGSPRGSPIPGILQARTLEWVAVSFSNA